MWKDIGFAICTAIGSYVNEKQKKSLNFKISTFKKKKKNDVWRYGGSPQHFTFTAVFASRFLRTATERTPPKTGSRFSI